MAAWPPPTSIVNAQLALVTRRRNRFGPVHCMVSPIRCPGLDAIRLRDSLNLTVTGWRPTILRVCCLQCTSCGHVWRQDTRRAAAARAKRRGAWVLKPMIGSRTAPARKPTAKVIGSISRSAPKELTELATHRRHQQRLNRGDQRLGQAPGLRMCRADRQLAAPSIASAVLTRRAHHHAATGRATGLARP